MRFLSAKLILENTLKVLRNYPLESSTCVAGTAIALELNNPFFGVKDVLLIKLLMIASLALPSFLAVTIRNRFRGFSVQRKSLEYLVIAILLTLFYLSIGKTISAKDSIRFALLNTAAHLFVSCAGFINRGSTSAFWQFNKELFLQIVTAAIFSGVLFAGLAGAVAATDVLFALHVKEDWYFRLFIVITGIFNTFFFLSHLPLNADNLETNKDYPKVLKVFTQFVLVPLVIIYLIILLAYEAKIIIRWNLPQGWVSNLILAYGVAGILSLLLVYPIRSAEGNSWIKAFAKWFYVLLLPLVLLMFIAIGIRIGTYGFTEERALVLALAIWLAAISLYYLFRPNGDIRIIPASLACVALLLNFIIFPVSLASQRNRLYALLQKNHLLSGTKAIAAKKGQVIPFKDRKNISSIVYYLLQNHGNESLLPWFETDTMKEQDFSAYFNAITVLQSLKMEYVDNYVREDDTITQNTWKTINSRQEEIDISGYDYLLPPALYYDNAKDTAARFRVTRKENELLLHDSGQLIATLQPALFFDSLIKQGNGLEKAYLPKEQLRQDIQTEKWHITIFYDRLSGYTSPTAEKTRVEYEALILLKKK